MFAQLTAQSSASEVGSRVLFTFLDVRLMRDLLRGLSRCAIPPDAWQLSASIMPWLGLSVVLPANLGLPLGTRACALDRRRRPSSDGSGMRANCRNALYISFTFWLVLAEHSITWSEERAIGLASSSCLQLRLH